MGGRVEDAERSIVSNSVDNTNINNDSGNRTQMNIFTVSSPSNSLNNSSSSSSSSSSSIQNTNNTILDEEDMESDMDIESGS